MSWSSPTPSSTSATTEPDQTASFRVYTIGIVTHGGIQDPSWKHGPPWELEDGLHDEARGLRLGDSLITGRSRAARPARRSNNRRGWPRIILHAASKFPAGDPVDLEFVGHSEGTVVNTYALVKFASEMTRQPQGRRTSRTPCSIRTPPITTWSPASR